MRLVDLLRLTFSSLGSHRMRSSLTALGIGVGIAAVILLTSIGEGIHQFVIAEFTQFGTNIIGVTPGKAVTRGASIGIFGSDRPLSLDDAAALKRTPYAVYVVPALQGNAEVSAAGRSRRTTVYGVGPDFPAAFKIPVAAGRFLPHDDPNNARAFVALGAKVRSELFGAENPLGGRLEIGGNRYRIIGIMAAKGQVLGIDLDDSVYIPAGRALELFNREGLMEIDVVHSASAPLDKVVEGIRRILTARHGRE
ncbi:MAG: ABC transporter permease, partial [Burkholderiales bacterium]